MGWSFACDKRHDKAACVAMLLRPERFSAGYTLAGSRVVGNRLWTLINCPDGRTIIGLDLLAGGGKQGMGWGYKGMDEESGPYVYDCPLWMLDAASEPRGHAVKWREMVRQYHAAKKEQQAIAPGDVVIYSGHQYRLCSPAGPRRGWQVERVSDGSRFRMRSNQLAKAERVV